MCHCAIFIESETKIKGTEEEKRRLKRLTTRIEMTLLHTLKKNGSKEYQKRVLRLVTIAEPFLVLNRAIFIRFHIELYFGNAIRDLNDVINNLFNYRFSLIVVC